MLKDTYSVLGVMSGTSLDGIDIAECYFFSELNSAGKKQWRYNIGVAETIPYPDSWKRILQDAIHFSEGRLKTLNNEYTVFLGSVISEFLGKHAIKNLDAVCSHGHTILHQPSKGVTLQIGNLPALAEMVKSTIVCDFRVQDVALGGQGAPLVPIGDRLLFSEYDYCLNLGGFANCSYEWDSKRVAYDICPVNIVMNALSEPLGSPYDAEGEIARSGKVDSHLLKQLNALEYYSLSPPKSLGLEWVQEKVMPILKHSQVSVADQLATFSAHVAQQLANQFDKESTVLITGGGAYNSYLLEQISAIKDLSLVVPDSILVEFKEALVFALLGVLRLRNEVNTLGSVTGASKDHSAGVIFTC